MVTDKRCNFSVGGIVHDPHRWWDGQDTGTSKGYKCDGKIYRTTEEVKRVGKRPEVGDVIDGRTGRETVLAVRRNGLILEVQDAKGRDHIRERSPGGYWRILA